MAAAAVVDLDDDVVGFVFVIVIVDTFDYSYLSTSIGCWRAALRAG